MEIKSLSATFGRLENDTLELSPGLNIIEAPNESGKTTWMTFLRVMLYGLNTRDRSPHADKHRYLPWSGSPMQGRMDLLSGGDCITIRRATTRANSPMGSFAAEYTNTTTPVPSLTAASLGETLLGIPQDVFERSAFIRQSGISIDQSASLERRITSLVTTGDEDSSYTDAADRLRRQLTRRRYNKTGLLPQLENEITLLEGTLSEIDALETSVRTCENESDTLSAQDAYLRRQLTLIDAAEHAQRAARLDAAKQEVAAAESAQADAAARAARLPSRDELTTLIGDLSAADAMTATVAAAQERAASLADSCEQSRRRLEAHPFAAQTPDELSADTGPLPPRPRAPVLSCLLSAFFAAALFLVLHYLIRLSRPLSILCAAVWMIAGTAWIARSAAHRRSAWERELSRLRSEREEQITAYTALYNENEQKRADSQSSADAYRALAAEQQLYLERILSRVQKFHPCASLSDARRAIEEAFSLHAAHEAAHRAVQQARLRFDLLSENTPVSAYTPTQSPELSRPEAEQRLAQLSERLSDLRRRIHTAQGRIQALGDPLLLRADLEQKRARYELLQKEYDAIALASEVLAEANTAMQNRFSPALGEKSASIFTKLTQKKYNKVLLDRKLIPSAQEDGTMLPRAIQSLSQGTADQLYLAVRLAICDMVLPPENSVPIFLDDALVTFDDDRMAAALDYLVALSQQRQILLFTCQQRELHYLLRAHPGRYHAIKLS